MGWAALRAALDLRAFGAAGYTATGEGQELVEPHREDTDARGHDELYVVLEGRARCTLDGETVDAPAGTLVRAGPEVHRAAVAVEVPATVLALGAPPDFEIAGSEWGERARPLMRTDPERARAILADGLRALPESAAIRVELARLAAIEDRPADGRAALREALEREPRIGPDAEADPDLAPLMAGLR